MTYEQQLEHLRKTHRILGVIELDSLLTVSPAQWSKWLGEKLQPLYKPAYENNERIVFAIKGYKSALQVSDLLSEVQRQLNDIDISNWFVILLTPQSQQIQEACNWVLNNISVDNVPTQHITFTDSKYNYNSSEPVKISLDSLLDRERYLLTESKTFCMYPWIHLHAYPTGQAYPCCMSDMKYSIGNCKTQTLKEIWNSDKQRELRQNMINDVASPACATCYEKEQAGFFSGRMSANKHHGHHINKVRNTNSDGSLDQFEMVYWDIRFSNLCNLSCRSCGHIFSSSWYQDQVKLAGPEYKLNNQALNYAGRTETDIWEQLEPHLDYVEQIYFAGGEPLLMDEHYRILEELERRGRFDVRLIYNTNFTHVKLKDRLVFDYWKRFESVSVGASLDAMGPRAEYIRKGTTWATVEQNRRQMLEICPQVDFYISPTVSIMNAAHVCEFHRYMVDQGLIGAQDVNINVLQDPPFYRIDIATEDYKQKLKAQYEQHLEWLRPRDHLRRATVGYESLINFMMNTDNSSLLPRFWSRTRQLDEIRNENIFNVLPELEDLR